MATTKRDTIFSAVTGAVADRLSQRQTLRPVPESVRLDGRTCLVTGANSGLGKAVAMDLAKRGGRVLGGTIRPPAAVNSNLAREAPVLLKPLLYPIMWLFFAAPEKAAAPVTYACCSEDLGRRTGVYLHLMQEKQPSRLAMDEGAGARLWSESSALLARHVTGGEADGSGALSDQPAGDA